jgi:hypothetical protein
MREGCLAPTRATAPVNLLEASIVADGFLMARMDWRK